MFTTGWFFSMMANIFSIRLTILSSESMVLLTPVRSVPPIPGVVGVVGAPGSPGLVGPLMGGLICGPDGGLGSSWGPGMVPPLSVISSIIMELSSTAKYLGYRFSSSEPRPANRAAAAAVIASSLFICNFLLFYLRGLWARGYCAKF